MYTSHGVPVKASTYCRRKNLAATITQSQWAQGLGDRHCSTFGNNAGTVPPSSTCLYVLNRTCEPNPTLTPVKAVRNPIRARSGFHLCGHEFVELVSVDSPADVIRSFLNVSQDSLIVMVPFAFIACLENRTPIFAVSRQIRLRLPEGGRPHGLQREGRALVSWCDAQVCTLPRHCFFRLCPRNFTYFCFSLFEAFTCEARNDLAEPVKVVVFEGVRIKAFSHGFSRFTTSHECAEVSASVRRSKAWLPGCHCPLSCSFGNNFEVCKSTKWVFRV